LGLDVASGFGGSVVPVERGFAEQHHDLCKISVVAGVIEVVVAAPCEALIESLRVGADTLLQRELEVDLKRPMGE
jgi:hypothetical protein